MYKIERRVQVFAGFAGIIAFGLAQAAAEERRADDIVRALAPALTRSLSSGPSATAPEQAADEAFVNSVRDRGPRSLSVGEVDHLDRIVSARKEIDFEMKFAYNSAALTGKDKEIAEDLGKALSSPALKDQTFLIMGHTDAKGSNSFNQKLSERRAA
ncbi:MAG: OmpA family protein, partial [Methylocystis sp.]